MEKKLKINFILKGIAVFAFVAFCLLAILAGVTLPFVSNARTADFVVASAESDFAIVSSTNDIDYELFSIPLSQCNGTDTYYGFYITETFYNYISNFDFSGDFSNGVLCFQVNPVSFYGINKFTDVDNNVVKYFGYTYGFDTNKHYIVTNDFTYLESDKVFINPNGFTFLSDDTGIFPGLFSACPDQVKMFLRVFNRLPYKETVTTVYKTGFKSRFGFIGDLKNNKMYFNLHSAPIIPEEIYCPYRDNTLVNYNKIGNDYYLSIVDTYDSSGNVVSDGFSGWKFTNILNPDNTPTSFYELDFYIRSLRVCHIDTVQFVDSCFTTPNYDNTYYTVSSSFSDGAISAYVCPESQYLYSLTSYLTKDNVSDFFALFDYVFYVPLNDAFYLAGLNAASKGYYDDGYNKGYSVGEDVGYNSGFSAGDSAGFARGVESANNYSFLSLFGAIFDAPIQALFGGTQRLPAGTKITDSNGNTITLTSDTIVNRGGMLNFNLMGVNLSGFVLALFSLSILIVVIKFALVKGR